MQCPKRGGALQKGAPLLKACDMFKIGEHFLHLHSLPWPTPLLELPRWLHGLVQAFLSPQCLVEKKVDEQILKKKLSDLIFVTKDYTFKIYKDGQGSMAPEDHSTFCFSFPKSSTFPRLRLQILIYINIKFTQTNELMRLQSVTNRHKICTNQKVLKIHTTCVKKPAFTKSIQIPKTCFLSLILSSWELLSQVIMRTFKTNDSDFLFELLNPFALSLLRYLQCVES